MDLCNTSSSNEVLFSRQPCSQQILVKPLLHRLPHSPSQAQRGAIRTKIGVDNTNTTCTYTLKPPHALLWGGIKRNKATSWCPHSLESQIRNNGCLCLGKIVIYLIMSNKQRWRARCYISIALKLIRTFSHVLSGGWYSRSQTYGPGGDCGLARFLISCEKLFYGPVGNAITSHQALCTPAIQPVRRGTALLPRQKCSPFQHKEPLITRCATLGAIVSRCWLCTRRRPMRYEQVAALEACEVAVIVQFWGPSTQIMKRGRRK